MIELFGTSDTRAIEDYDKSTLDEIAPPIINQLMIGNYIIKRCKAGSDTHKVDINLYSPQA